MPNAHPVRWEPRETVEVPASAVTPLAITSLARQLNQRERDQLVQAFNAGLYEMGTTFVWSRTMAGLKNLLAGLGIEFIAEMLDRADIRPSAEVHEVLTDYEAVRLAEELGMFGSTQALRLRQTLEMVAHFANPPEDADEDEMMPEEALRALRTCVQTVLGHEELEVAVEFAEFRRRLESSILDDSAAEIEALATSAYFFRRTVLRILLAACKGAGGAKLENALANLNIVLPRIWPGLKDPDRYSVGRAYSEVHAGGQSKAASGLRSSLLKVSGFDYVPETLRSSTFLEAAAKVESAHFGWNNFYNEPAPIRALASLGTSIPISAFHRCMTAVLLVRIGNPYGVSTAALPYADEILGDVTTDRWKYFFDSCLPVDDVVLGELRNEVVAERWCELMQSLRRISDTEPSVKRSQAILAASLQGETEVVVQRAARMLQSMRKGR